MLPAAHAKQVCRFWAVYSSDSSVGKCFIQFMSELPPETALTEKWDLISLFPFTSEAQ